MWPKKESSFATTIIGEIAYKLKSNSLAIFITS